MANLLAKLDDVKAALEFSGDGYDAQLTAMLEAATAAAARMIGVSSLIRTTGIIEYPRARSYGQRLINLKRWPVESVTQLKLAHGTADADEFADLTTLVQDTDFQLGQSYGRVELFYGETFSTLPRSNQLVYTAGYIDPAEADPPEGSLAVPEDLQRAVIIESVRLWKTRDAAGLATVDAGKSKGGRSLTYRPEVADACPELKAACAGLRRVSL